MMITLDHFGYFLLSILLAFLVLRIFDAQTKPTDLLWLPLLTFGFYWFMLNYCIPYDSANLWTNLFSELPYNMRENFDLDLQINRRFNGDGAGISEEENNSKREYIKALDSENLQPNKSITTAPYPLNLTEPPETTTFATVVPNKSTESPEIATALPPPANEASKIAVLNAANTVQKYNQHWDQPINQLLDQPFNQLLDRPVSEILNQLSSHLLNAPLNQLLDQPLSQLLNQQFAQFLNVVLNLPLNDILMQFFNQPLNQFLNQLSKLLFNSDQSLDQFLMQPLNKLLNYPLTQPSMQPFNELLNKPLKQPLNELLDQTLNTHLNKLTHHLMNQTLDQILNYPLKQFLGQSLNQILTQLSNLPLNQILDQLLNSPINQILDHVSTELFNLPLNQLLEQPLNQLLNINKPLNQLLPFNDDTPTMDMNMNMNMPQQQKQNTDKNNNVYTYTNITKEPSFIREDQNEIDNLYNDSLLDQNKNWFDREQQTQRSGVQSIIQNSILNQLARETESNMVPPMPPYPHTSYYSAAHLTPDNSANSCMYNVPSARAPHPVKFQQHCPSNAVQQPASLPHIEQNFYINTASPLDNNRQETRNMWTKSPMSSEFAWSKDSSRLSNNKQEIAREKKTRQRAINSGEEEKINRKQEGTIHIKLGKIRNDEVPIKSQPAPTSMNRIRSPGEIPKNIYADKAGGERILNTDEWHYSFDGLLPHEFVARMEEKPPLKMKSAYFPGGVTLNSPWSEWKQLP